MKNTIKGMAIKNHLLLGGYRPSLEYIIGKKKKNIQIKRVEDEIPFLSPDPGFYGKPIFLDMTTAGLILIVSPPGAGKTYLMRGMVSEMIDAGYLCVDLSSIKNNFYWSMYPVQRKFHRFLPTWRYPHGLPVVPFVPIYLKRRISMLKGMKDGSISINDVEPEDVTYMCGFENNSIQSHIIKLAWSSGKKPKSIDDLIKGVFNVNKVKMLREISGDNKKTFQQVSINATTRALFFLKQENLFGSDNVMDFVKVLETPMRVGQNYFNGGFPVLCFGGQREPKRYHTAYQSTIARQIYRKKTRRSSKLSNRRIVFIFDDIGTLSCPSKGNPPSKDVILNDIVSLGREYGIYCLASTQNLSQVPEDIVRQAKYFIFFKNVNGTDLDIIARARRKSGSFMRKRFSSIILGNYPPNDPNGVRSCLVLKDDDSSQIGWIPAPSSYHSEQV